MTLTQHDSDPPNLYRTIVDFLAGRLPGLGAVYLFGSRAAGREAADEARGETRREIRDEVREGVRGFFD